VIRLAMADNILPLDAIEFDPQNARRRTERSSSMIRESLQQFGPLRSLVGQKLPDGRIIVRAGNGTKEEAASVGIDKVRVIERKADELVIVVADDLDESKWKSYAIADNRSSDLSEWDTDVLSELAQEVELGEWFTDEEMAGWDVDAPYGEEIDPDKMWEGMPEFENPDASAPYSIKVNFYSVMDLEEFAQLVGQTVTENTKWINFPYREHDNLKRVKVVDES